MTKEEKVSITSKAQEAWVKQLERMGDTSCATENDKLLTQGFFYCGFLAAHGLSASLEELDE